MILLLAGTSETAVVAGALAAAGRQVLVSTATRVALDVGGHANIRRRCGRLDAAAMARLVRRAGIRAIVDVSHPYAVQLRATAAQVARATGIPYWTFIRPPACVAGRGVRLVGGHREAARVACAPGRTVLLTVGSRNVAVYAREAARRHARLIARILPNAASRAACRAAGLARAQLVTGRGPFDVAANRALIRRFAAGVVVTKDSGVAGGFPAKREAARREGCLLIVVGRAPQPAEHVFKDTRALVRVVLKMTVKDGAG